MAFTRPTLAELVDRVQQDLVSRLELTGAVLRRSMVHILSRVVAGAVHGLHGHLDFISRQIFADTAEVEYLDRIGGLYGIDRTEAEYATGDVTFTGTNTTNIPSGTVLVRSDGAEYTTDALATISGGEATVAVTASNADEASNSDAGVVLNLASPISGVDSEATVETDGLTGGADEEDDDAYRARVLSRLSNPPQGGSDADYEAWALEVPGVTRAWVYPLEDGAGTVTVRFVRDDDADLIPDAGEVSDVQDYIDERRPVTATVTVAAPTELPVDYELSVVPDTAEVRAAVEAELADLHLRVAEPGVTLPLSAIRTAIGIAAGLTDYDLTDPVADVTVTTGQFPTLGDVDFT